METPLRILMLEDSPTDAELIQEILESEGIGLTIERVETREAFVAALERGGFDVILSDNRLPSFNGLAALGLAQEKCPEKPFIFVSGTLGEELAIESLKQGATDYVLKQRMSRLAPAVRRALQEIEEQRRRKRAEEALRQSEERFRALTENAYDLVGIIDGAGTLNYASPSVERILGYKSGDVMGMRVFDLVHPEDVPAATDALLRTLDDPRRPPRLLDIRVRHADRTWRILEGMGSNLLDNPAVGGIVLNFRDVTERNHAEEQVRHQLEQVTALRMIDQAISASTDLRVTLGVLLNQVITQLRVDAACIFLLNPYSQRLGYTAGCGFRSKSLEHSSLRLGEGFAGRAALERRTIKVPNLAETEDNAPGLLDGEGFVACCATPLVIKGKLRGVLETFRRARQDWDPEWLTFLETLAGQAAIAIDNAELFQGLQRSNAELVLAYETTLEGWSRALDLRDRETEGHTLRVTELTVHLAQAMGISESEQVHVRRGALLHDIGKLGVPDSILLKPGKLTDEEWIVMKKHPELAYALLSPIPYLRPALDIPYSHHEKWDGTGYPQGLKGERIPLVARIFSVVDVWDALRSDRPYRLAWPEEQTIEYLLDQSARHFDPQVVECFLRNVRGKL